MNHLRLAFVACGLGVAFGATAAPIGSAFTYQGLLTDAGQAANGLYDLQFCLFDDPVTPLPRACVPDFDDVPVANGGFAVALDFGPTAFAGELLFLELRVRPGVGGAYTILTPRQAIRPAPEALRAAASSAAPWSGLTGVPAGFADNVDNDTNSGGTVTQVVAGAGLAGGTITGSGTISIANGGVDGGMVAAGAISTTQLKDGGVTLAKMADASVSQAQLLASIVNSATIIDGTVTQIDLAPNAVGLAQIDPTQVQARVTGTCPAGEYFRGIEADGSLTCEPVPGLSVASTVDSGGVGIWNDIAILPDGRPVISYYDSVGANLKFARCANAACTGTAATLTVDASVNDVGTFSSIAVGTDGLPVISYYDATDDNLKVLHCANVDCNSGGNAITTVDAFGNVGQLTSIAIGLDGNPVVAYYLLVGPFFYDGDFKVAKCANPACTGAATITTFDPAGTSSTASQISIAVPPVDGLPVIAYQVSSVGPGAVLWVAKCINANCTGTPTRTAVHFDPGEVVGAYAALAVGTASRPVVAYNGIGGSLALARCLNAACTSSAFETVAGADASYMDIAIGPDGLPVVSQQNPASDDLIVTRCLTSDCSQALNEPFVTQAAVDGNGGPHTSMAIGADGLPVIAFEDASSLRVVKCGNRACQ